MSMHGPSKKAFIPIFCLVLTLVYTFLFSKYQFYANDHTTQLPSILRFFDPGLYRTDEAMQMLNPVSVKMLPHLIIFLAARILHVPVEILYFVAYLAVVYATFALTFKIAVHLTDNWNAGISACILIFIFALNHVLNSSTFNIIHIIVVPNMIAVPLHLLCFYLAIRRKFISAFVVAGLLFTIHGQISLYTVLPLMVMTATDPEQGWRRVLKGSLCYVVFAAPIIVSLAMSFGDGTPSAGQYSLEELSQVRVPHHIFPSLKKVGIIAAMTVSMFILLRTGRFKCRNKLTTWVGTLSVIYLCGFVFVRLIPIDFFMLMYCMRVDVFLRIFFFIALSASLMEFLDTVAHNRSSRWFTKPSSLFLCANIILLATAAIISPPKLEILRSISPKADGTDRLCDFIRDNTPKDSLLITPPYIHGIRLHAERSVVVEFKTNPIGWGSEIQDEWMHRLNTICKVDPLETKGWDIKLACWKGYFGLSLENFHSLCHQYKADYFLTYAPRYMPERFANVMVFEDGDHALYRCP